MRGQRLQEIQVTDTEFRQLVPEAVVAPGPHDPGIASLDLLPCEGNTAVHVVEVFIVGRWERSRSTARTACFVEYLPRPRLVGLGATDKG